MKGRSRWTARYIKEVDAAESTTMFVQEIYDEAGMLREVHQKYPVDLGHQRLNKIGAGEHLTRNSLSKLLADFLESLRHVGDEKLVARRRIARVFQPPVERISNPLA